MDVKRVSITLTLIPGNLPELNSRFPIQLRSTPSSTDQHYNHPDDSFYSFLIIKKSKIRYSINIRSLFKFYKSRFYYIIIFERNKADFADIAGSMTKKLNAVQPEVIIKKPKNKF